MKLKTTLLGKTYTFRDVKDVLAKANEEKTGDKLAGLAAESARERVAAKVVLSEMFLEDLRENPAVPYEDDEVTRIIQDDLNRKEYEKIRRWTVSELREWILSETTTGVMADPRIVKNPHPIKTITYSELRGKAADSSGSLGRTDSRK